MVDVVADCQLKVVQIEIDVQSALGPASSVLLAPLPTTNTGNTVEA